MGKMALASLRTGRLNILSTQALAHHPLEGIARLGVLPRFHARSPHARAF